ncbi:MAG: tyrosine-type recombinase/integrase [Desulfobulbaceae bacterium]
MADFFCWLPPSKNGELPPNAGGKWWRFKYRFQGKEKLLSFGTYPEVSLASARERRDAARKLVASGIDPSASRKEEKEQWSGEGTFEAVAREWIELKSPGWSPSHIAKTTSILEKDVLPYIGSRPISPVKNQGIQVASLNPFFYLLNSPSLIFPGG